MADPNKKEPAAPVVRKRCVFCSETYSEEKDPYHLENCRDASKP